MRNNPLISIILPTYNGIRYLDLAIKSCLDQSYSNWELIVVDDASTDQTPAQIQAFMADDNRIKYIRHETNQKLPRALNTGFAIAQGDYYTWTSDDNCYRPQALFELAAFLESNPEADIVYTDWTLIDQAGHPVEHVSVEPSERLGVINCIGPCFLYRRIVHKKLGGYAEDLFGAEDYDFWLRASVFFKMYPLHQDLYLYRAHGASLTSQKADRISCAKEEAIKRNLPHMAWMSNPLRAKAYLFLARKSQERREITEARSLLLKTMHYSIFVLFQKMPIGLIVDVLLGSNFGSRLRSVYQKLST
jgi:glycosyltransferase involved in cell wall biosynthesis